MPGAPDPLYVTARDVLLDALEALRPHRSSLVLVGAQAIYLHTGEADIAVAPFTTDADVVIDPQGLADEAIPGDTLAASGFTPGDQPGQWLKRDVRVDLMAPGRWPGRGGAASGSGLTGTVPLGTRAAWKVLLSIATRGRSRTWRVGDGASRSSSRGQPRCSSASFTNVPSGLTSQGRLKDKNALDVTVRSRW